jgi:hypothetical protein
MELVGGVLNSARREHAQTRGVATFGVKLGGDEVGAEE